MAKSFENQSNRSSKTKSVVPSYGPGNSLYSSTDCLTEEDIQNYFRIHPTRSNSSLSRHGEKTIEYLRPTSFEHHQQKQIEQSARNHLDRIPYATFHEKYHILFFFDEFDSILRFSFHFSMKKTIFIHRSKGLC